jgi:FkbM family methyltransferase
MGITGAGRVWGTNMLGKVAAHYQAFGARAVILAAARRALPANLRPMMVEPNLLDLILRTIASKPSFNIIQIGAYVGDTENDPLARFIKETMPRHRGARAILVEPVAPFFERLKDNYKGIPGLFFENVAIAETAGKREFHRLAVDPTEYGFPEWVAQLGSLRSDRMTSLWDKYENQAEIQEFFMKHKTCDIVDCVTIDYILSKYSIVAPDMIQIDTEGYASVATRARSRVSSDVDPGGL